MTEDVVGCWVTTTVEVVGGGGGGVFVSVTVSGGGGVVVGVGWTGTAVEDGEAGVAEACGVVVGAGVLPPATNGNPSLPDRH